MSEKTERYKKEDVIGQWRLKTDNSIVWEQTKSYYIYDIVLQSWVKDKVEKTEVSPEESPFKLAKVIDVDVLLLREKDDDDSLTGKTLMYYLRKMRISVRPDQKNVWLHLGDNKKVFVKNLLKMYTYMFNLGEDPQVTVKQIGKDKRITQEVAKNLNTGYCFSKYEKLDDETDLYGIYVKPSTQ